MLDDRTSPEQGIEAGRLALACHPLTLLRVVQQLASRRATSSLLVLRGLRVICELRRRRMIRSG